MNTRERFHAIMNSEAGDRPLDWEFSPGPEIKPN